jgi:hypothetical protein
VDVERVEAFAVVADHVGEPLVVEQNEDLVVLAPQLAEPLQHQRLGGDDQGALGAAGVEQPVHDQAGLDGLAEADLVGEQPAHRVGPRGALGDVELVRVEANAAAQERAEPAGLAQPRQPEAVQAVGEVLEAVHLAACQSFQRRHLGRQRPERLGFDLAAVGETADAAVAGLDGDGLAGAFEPRPDPRRQHQRHQGVRARREAQPLAGLGELDDQAPPADLADDPGSELGVETMGQAVAGLPHGGGILDDKTARPRKAWPLGGTMPAPERPYRRLMTPSTR